jgi:hypothetical protein
MSHGDRLSRFADWSGARIDVTQLEHEATADGHAVVSDRATA